MAKRLAALAVLLFLPAAAQQPPGGYVVSVPEGLSLPGFVQDALAETYRRIGLGVSFRTLPSARSIDMANAGETDAEAARTEYIAHDFPNLVRIPEPFLTVAYSALSLGPPPAGSSWPDLRDHSVCVVLGNKMIERRTQDMNPKYAHTVEAGLRMLMAGRCEVLVASQFVWLIIDRLRLGRFCQGPPIEEFTLYHYVNRRHQDLVPRLTATMQEMNRDGTIQRLLAASVAPIEDARKRHDCTLTGADRPSRTVPPR